MNGIERIKRRKAPNPTVELHPNRVVSKCLAARGIQSPEDLLLTLDKIHKPDLLPGLQEAAKGVIEAVKANKKILVVGDYDADGATASAVLLRLFSMLGYRNVDFLVPNRFDYGYGLSLELVPEILKTGAQLVITVDNGISSIAGVDACNNAGVDVIVTDHHLPGEQLPNALAIVNPNLPGSAFPSRNLAGVGVAFYLAGKVMRLAKNENLLDSQKVNIKSLIDLVALGTMADVVPLDKNNRILIKAGIDRIRNGKACTGIKALLKVSKKNEESLTEECLSFYLAPRLNAAGRLEDMKIGIRLLTSDDPQTCENLAETLDEINRERKNIQYEMQQLADSVVRVLKEKNKIPFGVSLFHKDWHQGLVGLIAGKVKEQVNRPTVAFAIERPGVLKGSARSVKGIHIRDALAAISTKNPGLIDKFGGHAMAAGMSIKQNNLTRFSAAFDAYVKAHSDSIVDDIVTDGPLTEADICNDLAESIIAVGPWGQSFPFPMFDNTFEIVEKQEIGKGHSRLRLRLPDGFHIYNAVFFNHHPCELPPEGKMAHFVYEVSINEYRGLRKMQIMVKHFFRIGARGK